MSAILPLSIVGTIVAFLLGALGYFPTPGGPNALPEADPIDETYSVERLHQAANLFAVAYTSVVDDLVSYQKDADYERAEDRRQEMLLYGYSLLPRFQQLEERLQGQAEELMGQAQEANGEAAS